MNRQILLYFICIFLLSNLTNAQETQLDSLLNELPHAQDTAKIDILNALADQVYRSDPDKTIQYGLEAKDLSEQLDYQKGLAFALKNIGLGYFNRSNYVEASITWEQSFKIFESLKDESSIANLLGNIGSAYSYMGDDTKAVDYLLRSLKIAEKIGDSLRMATCLMNLGGIYSYIPENVDKALPYYLRAVAICELINYPVGIGLSSFNLGDYYFQKEMFDSALYYFEKSIVDEGTIDEASSLNNIGKVYAVKKDFQTAIKYQNEALEIAEKIDAKLEMSQIFLGLANTYHIKGDEHIAIDYFELAKSTAEEIDSNYELKDAFQGLSNIYANRSDFRNAYTYQTLLNEVDKAIYNSETDDKIKNLNFTFQLDKKQDEIEILEQRSEIEQLKNKRQEAIIAGIGFTVLLLIVLAIVLFNRFKFARKASRMIQKEKDRSDNLLLNILPYKTAEELKEKGKAKARKYDSVTILFTDFKEFTNIAADLDPEVLVNEINHCYIKFDEIITRYGIEKIKTIGDAYMAAGGLPIPNNTHADDVIKAAIEIRDFMLQLKAEREKENKLFFEIRIGIHTGPVVAGIVGTKKFAYDIWGDTVNCASRMEAASEPGKINISECTYQLIKDNYKCSYRGEFEAKNRGKMKMYFVEEPIYIPEEVVS